MGHGKNCSSAEKIVIEKLRQQGKTYREIAALVGRSKNMVARAIHNAYSTKKRGNKRKTSVQTDRQIVKLSKIGPFKSPTAIKSELNLTVSECTIRRRLVENNLNGRSARRVPLLSNKNIKSRLLYAKEHADWNGDENIKKWRNILWSDESKVNMFGSDGRRYVRRPVNEGFRNKYTIKTVKHGGGNIKVWGCFSYDGVGPIYWIKEIMDQHIYVDEILEKVMLPYAENNMPLRWVFMQDNDPKHTSRKARTFFEKKNVHLLKWPAQSPDLNPIENLWKDLKIAVASKRTSSKEDLWKAIQEAWNAIPVERCRKLIDSLPRRCDAVIKNKGHSTKY